MRSIQTFSGLFLAILLIGPLWAQTEETQWFRGDLDFASKYVFRGLERAGASTQATGEFSRDNLRGGAWINLPLAGGKGSEADLNVAYSWQALSGMKWEASARQYWVGKVAADGLRQSFEAGISAALAPFNGFTPSVAFYYDLRLHADTTQVSLTRSIPLTGMGAFLDLNFFAGWVVGKNWRPDAPGPARSDGYSYWGADANLPYRIGPHSTVVGGLHFTDASGHSDANGPLVRSAGRNLWVTLGVSLDF